MKGYSSSGLTLGIAGLQYGYNYFKSKNQFVDSDTVWTDPMDRIVAGNSAVRQRTTHKRKLKSGRVGRKLQKLNDDFVFRWQRIFNYGQNQIAYPASITQGSNLLSGGRLQLSHYTDGVPNVQVNYMPVYLWDLTCWRTQAASPDVCRRLFYDSGGSPRWASVRGQQQTHSVVDNLWQAEKSDQSGVNFPLGDQQAALLKWVDMRMCFYGARKHPTRIIVELIQFKDEKYSMDYHPDGEAFSVMTTDDQNDVKSFWIEETKKLVYHPLDVQQFERSRAITSLYRDSFQIAPDDTTNLDVCPPNVVKKIFKRFNRLVKWNWNQPVPTVDPNANELELPTYNQEVSGQIEPFAHPHARIYLYIRAEDVDSVASTDPLYVAPVDAPVLSNNVQVAVTRSTVETFISDVDASATPSGTYVCGYDWKVDYENVGASDNRNYQGFLMPRFCQNPAVPEEWSTSTTPSFDIILRQKWVLQN